MANEDFDICVIGGGILGLVAALMCVKKGISVCVIDSNVRRQNTEKSERYFLLSVSSKRILSHIGLWGDLKSANCGLVNSIEVWGEGDANVVRLDLPNRLLPPMSWILSERKLLGILNEAVKKNNIPLFFSVISDTKSTDQKSEISLEDGTLFRPDLIIAADGRRSPTRSMLGIKFFKRSFEQTAIVVNVVTEKSHNHVARQHFLQGGPLAFLPLQDDLNSSVIWSVPNTEVSNLLELEPDHFNNRLAEAFNFTLGEILQSTPAISFPLEYGVASNFAHDKFALVGNAAHVFHPLAGQGLNLGFLDVATLLQCTTTDSRVNRSGLATSLRRYHGWRKSEALKLIAITTGLNSIYAQNSATIDMLRRLGGRVFNSKKLLKEHLIESAMGLRGDLPDVVKFADPP